VPFTDLHCQRAIDAYARFGKGRHPAALNFGDCMTYATATLARQPLLCRGDDFQKTDLSRIEADAGRPRPTINTSTSRLRSNPIRLNQNWLARSIADRSVENVVRYSACGCLWARPHSPRFTKVRAGNNPAKTVRKVLRNSYLVGRGLVLAIFRIHRVPVQPLRSGFDWA